MVDKFMKLTRNGKYKHNNNKGLMLNSLIVIVNNPAGCDSELKYEEKQGLFHER